MHLKRKEHFSSLLSVDCTAQDTKELFQPPFFLLLTLHWHPLLVQLGFAQALQFHPKVCLTYLVLLEYCEQWPGCSTPSKGAKWPLASTDASLGPWKVIPHAAIQAMGSASTDPKRYFSLDSVLCHGQDFGNSMGKSGEQYPTAHMGLRKALQAWHGSSSLHIFRPQKTPNFLQFSHFSTTTTYFPRQGGCYSLFSSPGQVFGNNWVFHERSE